MTTPMSPAEGPPRLISGLSLRGRPLGLREWGALLNLNQADLLKEVRWEVRVPALMAHLGLDPLRYDPWRGVSLDLRTVAALPPLDPPAPSDPFNPYGEPWPPERHARRIRDLMSLRGAWEPIVLDWEGLSSPSLWDGAHRLAAAWVLGLPVIEARSLLGALDEATLLLTQEGWS